MIRVLRSGGCAFATGVVVMVIGAWAVMAWASFGAPGHQWIGWPP